jgi:hypothetical protein
VREELEYFEATTLINTGTTRLSIMENPCQHPKEIIPEDLWNKERVDKISKFISAEAKKQTPEQNAEIARLSEKYKKIREEETLKEELKSIKENKAKKNNALANAVIDRFAEIGLLHDDLGNETMDVLEKFVQVFSEEIMKCIGDKKQPTKSKNKK